MVVTQLWLILVHCVWCFSLPVSRSSLVSSPAVPCSAGHFSRTGLVPCYPCPRDYYQPEHGRSYCLSCPFYGTTTVSGATTIQHCSSKCHSLEKHTHFKSDINLLCLNVVEIKHHCWLYTSLTHRPAVSSTKTNKNNKRNLS